MNGTGSGSTPHHPAEPEHCPACGHPAADAEGRCARCGARRPAGRDHLEIETDGAAAVTDRGLRHRRNEDAVALSSFAGLTVAVVCDGVSSSPRPDEASETAARTGAAALVAELQAGAEPVAATHTAAARAAQAVAALADSVHAAPACTYLSAIAGWTGITVGWVGDSRAYWIPEEGTPTLLTEDDVAVPGLLVAWLGADAGTIPARVTAFHPQAPGTLLLCSDGLWRYLPEPAALRTVVPAGPPLAVARRLLRHALDCGGRDNITIALIPVATAESPTAPVPRIGRQSR